MIASRLVAHGAKASRNAVRAAARLVATALAIATAISCAPGAGTASAVPVSDAPSASVPAAPRAIDLDAAAFRDALEASRGREGFRLIDVRTPAEFAEGHIDGAVLVDFSAPDFRERITAFPRDGSYLLYCRSGNRSGQALAVMRELGFTDVAHLEGGIGAWIRAGFPVAK